jgi:hypothetical protein
VWSYSGVRPCSPADVGAFEAAERVVPVGGRLIGPTGKTKIAPGETDPMASTHPRTFVGKVKADAVSFEPIEDVLEQIRRKRSPDWAVFGFAVRWPAGTEHLGKQ